MFGEDSLYRRLGLEEVASFEQIDNCWQRYCDRKSLSASSVGNPEIEEAFAVLRNFETKQVYDLLLDASSKPQMMLPRFNTHHDVEPVEELCKRLGIKLKQVSSLTFQILKNITSDNSFIERPRLTVPVGGAFLAFTAIPFSTEWDRLNEQVIIIPESEQNYAFAATSRFGAVSIGYGDRGLIVRAGLPSEPPRYNAAYLNQSQAAFGLLELASDLFFPPDNLQIAQKFGVRNSPVRIRQTMLEYFDGLADALTRFDNRIQLGAAKSAFRQTAKLFHSQFA